ncbi:MAG TPA: ABC transporter permease [Holophagaceae bacterium]|nr:ABC transporter permease [Holophagaceae bacterium]
MTAFLYDLRQAFGALRRAPGFTLAAMLTLALGIGATTALFSLTHQLLLGHLPYPEPDRLVAAFESHRGKHYPFAHQTLCEWRDQSSTLVLGGYSQTGLNLTGLGDTAVLLGGVRVTAGFFDALGVKPAMGRLFTRADEAAGASDKVVVTWAFWRNRLGSDPAVVGRSLVLDGKPTEIIGVLPETFLTPYARGEEIFKITPNVYTDNQRGSHSYETIARLKPGATLASANAELQAFGARSAAAYPDTNDGGSGGVEPLRESLTRDGRGPLLFLLGATGLLLLIACVNVTNLFLARAAAREREMAVRLALGAGRRQLLRQFFAEALVVAAGGTLFAGLMAMGLLRLLEPFALRGAPPSLLQGGVHLSGTAWALSLGLTLACAVAVAIAPTLQADRLGLREILAEGGRGLTSQRGLRFRRALVAAQIGLCLVLVLSTALFMRSLMWIEGRDPGFQAAGRMAFQVRLPDQDYPKEAQADRFFRELQARLQAIPGVESAAAGGILPFYGSHSRTVVGPDAQMDARSTTATGADMNIILPGWFETLGTPLREGRFPSKADLEDGTGRIWISESLAKKLFPGQSAVGRILHSGVGSETTPNNPPMVVTGVVADVHERNLDLPPEDRFWVLQSQYPSGQMALVIRSGASPEALRGPIQEALRGLDPRLPLSRIETLQSLVDRSLRNRRMVTALLGGFTLLALLLAAVGIHGVVSFQVAQRTREIGIRMALGAQLREVIGLILGQGLRLALWGLAVGLLVSLALGRVIASQIRGVQTLDPMSLALALGVLAASAFLASLLPALRAARVDPMEALRSE